MVVKAQSAPFSSAGLRSLHNSKEHKMYYYEPRRPQTQYGMDYIPDKQLFAAVMFARKMIAEGTPPEIAISRAAYYRRKPECDVAHYVGQAGRNSQLRRQASEQFMAPEDTL
jgi:hypothetical protein